MSGGKATAKQALLEVERAVAKRSNPSIILNPCPKDTVTDFLDMTEGVRRLKGKTKWDDSKIAQLSIKHDGFFLASNNEKQGAII